MQRRPMPDSWSLWVVIGICLAAGYGVTSRVIDAWRARSGDTPKQSLTAVAPDNDGQVPDETIDEDCFAVLGLSPRADEAAVRDAYRRLIRQYHPDKVANLGPELVAVAERETRRINAAYRQALRRAGSIRED